MIFEFLITSAVMGQMVVMDEDGEITSIWSQAPDRPAVVAVVNSRGETIRSSRGFEAEKELELVMSIGDNKRKLNDLEYHFKSLIELPPKPEPPETPETLDPKLERGDDPEPNEITLYQKLDNGKAQRLREKWLSQWIVQNRNIDQYAVYQQRQRLEMLSTKDILNIEKELNRQARLYLSRKAAYNRRVREANRLRYYYWYASSRGFRWYYGYYRGCY